MKCRRNNLFNASHHGGIRCALFCLLEKVRQRALWTNYGQKTDKITKFSTIDAAPGTARVPKCREETSKFNFLGFWCNYVVSEQLEAKNLENLGFFLALFGRNLACSSSKTMWLHQKPKNSNCVVCSQHFVNLAVPGAASIVEISILK